MYLNQIIALHRHIWNLQEEINLLSRQECVENPVVVNAELHRRITTISEEIVETIHAIEILKKVN